MVITKKMHNKDMKLGLIALANDSGLGAQTRRLAKMLAPYRVLVVDSSVFSSNKEQHFEWYADYETLITKGFPKNSDIIKFLDGLTHVLVCENPYNFYLVKAAKERNIPVYCQTNYEFCENLDKPYLPVPKFIMPSHWYLEEMQEKFGAVYLPPPIDPKEFSHARQVNLKRRGKPRFLHILGTRAFKDRNGTLDLLASLKYTNADFDLVIKSQHDLPGEYKSKDPRVTTAMGSYRTNQELYSGFDALILPRRYGGLSLTTNEALVAGLPVIMTRISPNYWLPKKWTVPSIYKGSFQARAEIPYYSVNHKLLGEKLDWLCTQDFQPLKKNAIYLSKQFDPKQLKPLYDKLLLYGSV